MARYTNEECDALWQRVIEARAAVAKNLSEETQRWHDAQENRVKIEAKVEQLNQDMNRRQASQHARRDELGRAETALADIRKDEADTQRQLDGKREELKHLEAEHHGNVTALQAKAKELDSAVGASERYAHIDSIGSPDRHEELVTSRDEFKSRVDELQAAYNQLMAVADSSQSRVDTVHNHVVAIEEGAEKLRAAMAASQSDVENADSKIRLEVAGGANDMEQRSAEWERLQSDLEEARDAEAHAEQAYKEALDRNKKRADELGDLQNEIQEEYWTRCQWEGRYHTNGHLHDGGEESDGSRIECWCTKTHGPHNLLQKMRCWCGVVNPDIGAGLPGGR